MTILITSWKALVDTYEEIRKTSNYWMFRGQCQDWPLQSSLERTIFRFNQPIQKLEKNEDWLVREFQRHYYRYSNYQPALDDRIEWLSIMQHHGTPTRLLDWTYSFYISVFFAIETASLDSSPVIWAIDSNDCWEIARAIHPDKIAEAERDQLRKSAMNEILASTIPLVCPLNPFFINERLTMQQGVLLAPCKASETFEKNFKLSIGTKDSAWKKIKIICSNDFLIEAFDHLHRMNITEATLFPGLDGFARSLRNKIPLRHIRPL